MSVDEWLQTALPSFPIVPEHSDQRDDREQMEDLSRFSNSPPVVVLGQATLGGGLPEALL